MTPDWAEQQALIITERWYEKTKVALPLDQRVSLKLAIAAALRSERARIAAFLDLAASNYADAGRSAGGRGAEEHRTGGGGDEVNEELAQAIARSYAWRDDAYGEYAARVVNEEALEAVILTALDEAFARGRAAGIEAAVDAILHEWRAEQFVSVDEVAMFVRALT